MTRTKLVLGAAILALSGCSSAGGVNPVISAVWNRVRPGPDAAAPAPATTAPALTRARIEELDIAMIRVRVGGATGGNLLTARTLNDGYATYSGSTQQTVTLYTSLITATRGIGFDLLSVLHAANDPIAVKTPLADWPESVPRDYRFAADGPSGRNVHVTCRFQPGPSYPLEIVEVTYDTKVVQEFCTGEAEFMNLHFVDSDGQLWRSAQWVGVEMGQFEIDILEPLE